LNIERNKYARDDNENHIAFCVGVQSKVAEIRVRAKRNKAINILSPSYAKQRMLLNTL